MHQLSWRFIVWLILIVLPFSNLLIVNCYAICFCSLDVLSVVILLGKLNKSFGKYCHSMRAQRYVSSYAACTQTWDSHFRTITVDRNSCNKHSVSPYVPVVSPAAAPPKDPPQPPLTVAQTHSHVCAIDLREVSANDIRGERYTRSKSQTCANNFVCLTVLCVLMELLKT